MSFVTVNKDKCINCMSCADVCPLKLLDPNNDPPTALPERIARMICIDCGHCVCACPVGAVDQRAIKAEDCDLVDETVMATPEQVDQLIRARRSIRSYQIRPVPGAELEKLIKVAAYAPTGHNFQNVSWKIFYERSDLVKLKELVLDWMKYCVENEPDTAKAFNMKQVIAGCKAGVDIILRDAPHLVVTHAKEEDRTAASSCTIALSYMDLAASSRGFGCCWAGFLDVAASRWPAIREYMDLPEGHISYASMMIGYPKRTYRAIPARKDPPVSWK